MKESNWAYSTEGPTWGYSLPRYTEEEAIEKGMEAIKKSKDTEAKLYIGHMGQNPARVNGMSVISSTRYTMDRCEVKTVEGLSPLRQCTNDHVEILSDRLSEAYQKWAEEFKYHISTWAIINVKEIDIPPMSDSSELLHCPFCGQTPLVTTRRREFIIKCNNQECPLSTVEIASEDSSEVISIWNKRSDKND